MTECRALDLASVKVRCSQIPDGGVVRRQCRLQMKKPHAGQWETTIERTFLISGLVDPAIGVQGRPAPALRHVEPSETQAVADCFTSARTSADPLVVSAYQQLESQTDRQFAALTDPQGPYRITVVGTSQATPYSDAAELIASVLTSRTLEVTTSAADRAHPLLDGEAGGAYYRFRAVHDLIGHVATGYGFDRDGEYSAWLVQRDLYSGLARWAAATELHGEISALWTTGQFAEHKAVLLDPRIARGCRLAE
jgi:hypothetical protein